MKNRYITFLLIIFVLIAFVLLIGTGYSIWTMSRETKKVDFSATSYEVIDLPELNITCTKQFKISEAWFINQNSNDSNRLGVLEYQMTYESGVTLPTIYGTLRVKNSNEPLRKYLANSSNIEELNTNLEDDFISFKITNNSQPFSFVFNNKIIKHGNSGLLENSSEFIISIYGEGDQ